MAKLIGVMNGAKNQKISLTHIQLRKMKTIFKVIGKFATVTYFLPKDYLNVHPNELIELWLNNRLDNYLLPINKSVLGGVECKPLRITVYLDGIFNSRIEID